MLLPHPSLKVHSHPAPPPASQLPAGTSQGSDANSSPKASILSCRSPGTWQHSALVSEPIPTSATDCLVSRPDGLAPTPRGQLSAARHDPATTYSSKRPLPRPRPLCLGPQRRASLPPRPTPASAPRPRPRGAAAAPSARPPAAAARASLQPGPDTSPAPTPARGSQPGSLPASARSRASPDGAGGGGRYL